MIYLIILLSLFFVVDFSHAESTSSGDVSFEYRFFEDDQKSNTKDINLAIAGRVLTNYSDGNFEFQLSFFGRGDQKQKSRSLVLLEDLYVSYYLEKLKFTAGYKKYNWSATEAFHPADMINSKNYDSSWESLEKKGELVLEVQRELGEGALTALFFPRFEYPVIPDSNSRLGFGVDLRQAQIVTEDGTLSEDPWHLQYGLELTQTFGNADIAIHSLRHINRYLPQVGFLSTADLASNSTSPIPFYYWTNQFGLTYQHVIQDFIVKVEYAHRDFTEKEVVTSLTKTSSPKDHSDLALGLEYLYELENAHEINFFLETETILGLTKEQRRSLTYFQNDLFFGIRYAFNDLLAKEVFVSIIKDLELDNEQIINLNYSQRLNNDWKIKTGLRYIDAKQKGDTAKGLEALDGDGHFSLTLSRYF